MPRFGIPTNLDSSASRERQHANSMSPRKSTHKNGSEGGGRNIGEHESTAPAGWTTELMLTKEGAPRAVIANAITAFRRAPELAGLLAFNQFTGCITTQRSTPWEGTEVGAEWTDNEDRLAANWLQRNGIFVTPGVVADAAQTVARDTPYHPVRNYLQSLDWDRTGRLDHWLVLYLGVAQGAYAAAVGVRWMISAVARIFQPGVKVDTCPILEGAQGKGKSTALRILGEPWFTDDMADLGTKDSQLQVHGSWIIELAELDSMTKGEVSRIKAFLSRAVDRFRPPYGRRLQTFPRQCVFAGTVNNSSYLRDKTGARRFWPLLCEGRLDLDGLQRARDQLWAEAVSRYKAGATWWLGTPELELLAQAEQEERFIGDPWDERIDQFLEAREVVTVEEVLPDCIKKPLEQWTGADQTRVSNSLKARGWQKRRPGRRGAPRPRVWAKPKR